MSVTSDLFKETTISEYDNRTSERDLTLIGLAVINSISAVLFKKTPRVCLLKEDCFFLIGVC